MMQDYDPKGSILTVLDCFTDISYASTILALCLEQIDENRPDLIPRLHWILSVLKRDMENVAEDGVLHSKRLRDYLYRIKPDNNEGDRQLED